MDQSIYLQLILADPANALKCALRFVHFIGLALGLGAATLLDLMLLRFFVQRTVSREILGVFQFSTRVVNLGLMILWITGLAFIVHYAVFDPDKLLNGKIWAKLTIVVVLTLNGLFIHLLVLPRLNEQVGKLLFAGMSLRQKIAFQTSGAISVTSWYVPVALGAFPQLNFAVPPGTILVSYLLLLGFVALAMTLLVALMERGQRSREPSPTYPAGLFHT